MFKFLHHKLLKMIRNDLQTFGVIFIIGKLLKSQWKFLVLVRIEVSFQYAGWKCDFSNLKMNLKFLFIYKHFCYCTNYWVYSFNIKKNFVNCV